MSVTLEKTLIADFDIVVVSVDYLANDISEGHYVSTSTAGGCQGECQRTAACNYWTWDP